MHNQFEQERQVTAVIQKYHREPIRAQQVHLARTERPNHVPGMTTRLRTTITSLLMKPRQQESPAFTEPVPETADSTATLQAASAVPVAFDGQFPGVGKG